jgi:hypothetical protein
MDVDAIQPGRDFRKAIHENVGGCSVLLAIIGPDWLEARDADDARRLDNENDYVRLEIAAALKRDIPVVPVIVRGARMPKASQLPEELRDLAYRNSVELTHARWKSDVQVLIRALSPYLCETDSRASESEVSHRPTAPALPHIAPAAMHTPAAAATSVAAVDETTIGRVSRELAFYIGPIAELVVKRASRRYASLPELCNAVAQEIEGTADRAKFLAACRR